MKIAFAYWTNRKVGGTETYLESIIAELDRAGHAVAFFHETEEPAANNQIALPPSVQSWCAANSRRSIALSNLKAWAPDIIYTHSLKDPDLEAETLKIAPAVFFAHAYYGTCISGYKTLSSPKPATPCQRKFGWQCMLNYYPRRCGGLNPYTMFTEYERQSARLRHLPLYKAIVTHSTYMRDEYLKHDIDPQRVHCLSYYVHKSHKEAGTADLETTVDDYQQPSPEIENGSTGRPWRLLFLGRMDRLKGGDVLVDALPLVQARLGRKLHVTFAGEGEMRKSWERRAAYMEQRSNGLKIHFAGWVDGSERESIWKNSHLLVVPSLWPEPFGLVGTEAGLRGIPTAAFAVGGITEWLTDGVNGYVASGNPPLASGLADAIVRCLQDPKTYLQLRRGALSTALQFSVKNHLSLLLEVFNNVTNGN